MISWSRLCESIGGFSKNKTMNKNATFTIIIGLFVGLAFCFAPKVFAVLLLLSIVVGVWSFFRWMLR